MAQVTPAPGLRERKKAKTRAALREHALALFREQGYAATTVEQISAAAEVSPATFFRYYPTKEDVVLQDDFDLVTLEALESQPAGLGPVAAFRAAAAVEPRRAGSGRHGAVPGDDAADRDGAGDPGPGTR